VLWAEGLWPAEGVTIDVGLVGEIVAVFEQEPADVVRCNDEDRGRLLTAATIELGWFMPGGVDAPAREHCQRCVAGSFARVKPRG
jgi:hypothetical protein